MKWGGTHNDDESKQDNQEELLEQGNQTTNVAVANSVNEVVHKTEQLTEMVGALADRVEHLHTDRANAEAAATTERQRLQQDAKTILDAQVEIRKDLNEGFTNIRSTLEENDCIVQNIFIYEPDDPLADPARREYADAGRSILRPRTEVELKESEEVFERAKKRLESKKKWEGEVPVDDVPTPSTMPKPKRYETPLLNMGKRGKLNVEFLHKENIILRILRCALYYLVAIIRILKLLIITIPLTIDRIAISYTPNWGGILGTIISYPLHLMVHCMVTILCVASFNVIGMLFGKADLGISIVKMILFVIKYVALFFVSSLMKVGMALKEHPIIGDIGDVFIKEAGSFMDDVGPMLNITIPRNASGIINATGLRDPVEYGSKIVTNLNLVGNLVNAGLVAQTAAGAVGDAGVAVAHGVGVAGEAVADVATNIYSGVTDFIRNFQSGSKVKQDGGSHPFDDMHPILRDYSYIDNFINNITIPVSRINDTHAFYTEASEYIIPTWYVSYKLQDKMIRINTRVLTVLTTYSSPTPTPTPYTQVKLVKPYKKKRRTKRGYSILHDLARSNPTGKYSKSRIRHRPSRTIY